MYRDSFTRNLLPFIADEFEQAYFSRLVPFYLEELNAYQADYLIIQKVERKIAAFTIDIPIMEPMPIRYLTGPEATSRSTLKVEEDGAWYKITGEIDEAFMTPDAHIFLSVRGESFEPKTYPVFYRMTKEGDGNGYQLYLKTASLPGDQVHINTVIKTADTIHIVATDVLQRKEH